MRVGPQRWAQSTEKEVSSFHSKPGANQRVTDKGAPGEEAAGGKQTGREREAGPALMPPGSSVPDGCLQFSFPEVPNSFTEILVGLYVPRSWVSVQRIS